jgi:hypothetical protein
MRLYCNGVKTSLDLCHLKYLNIVVTSLNGIGLEIVGLEQNTNRNKTELNNPIYKKKITVERPKPIKQMDLTRPRPKTKSNVKNNRIEQRKAIIVGLGPSKGP